MRSKTAFTLAELLIALAILGVIATFTIPKVLTAQNDGRLNAITKESAATITGAFQAYIVSNKLASSATMNTFKPYINYVSVDTAITVDDIQSQPAVSCSDTNATCLRLHNGATLWYWNYVSMDGTATTNAVFFHLDPDGVTSSNKAINLFLYANGKVRTEGELETNTVSSDLTRNAQPSNNPSWWSGW